MALQIGQSAPDFALHDSTGRLVTLSRELKGQACILFFYPKDFTSVCTAEACSFRDAMPDFGQLSVPIYGISPDPVETHARFRREYHLPYELLADPGKTTGRAYDILTFIGTYGRVTYLLDPDHKIRGVYSNLLRAQAHVDQMLLELRRAPR